MTQIVLFDPGHGGSDPGATGNGLREKDITLKIGKLAVKFLEEMYTGVDARLTRSTDVFISLDGRAAIANKMHADAFVSIHVNAGGGKGGYETFKFNGKTSAETGVLHKALHEAVSAVTNKYSRPDRGLKTANYAVLRETFMPAALTENLFIDVSADAALLKDTDFLHEVAKAHAVGVAKALKLKKRTTSDSDGKLYRVQLGAFKSKNNARELERKLDKLGFDTYVVKDEGLYKVQTGAYKVKANATKQQQLLTDKGYEALIITV